MEKELRLILKTVLHRLGQGNELQLPGTQLLFLALFIRLTFLMDNFS